jgi:hypothetical protein
MEINEDENTCNVHSVEDALFILRVPFHTKRHIM